MFDEGDASMKLPVTHCLNRYADFERLRLIALCNLTPVSELQTYLIEDTPLFRCEVTRYFVWNHSVWPFAFWK